MSNENINISGDPVKYFMENKYDHSLAVWGNLYDFIEMLYKTTKNGEFDNSKVVDYIDDFVKDYPNFSIFSIREVEIMLIHLFKRISKNGPEQFES